LSITRPKLTGTSSCLKTESFLLDLILKDPEIFLFQPRNKHAPIIQDGSMQHDQADLGLNLILPQLTFHRGGRSWRLGRWRNLRLGLLGERRWRDTPRAPQLKMSGDEPSIGRGYWLGA